MNNVVKEVKILLVEDNPTDAELLYTHAQ